MSVTSPQSDSSSVKDSPRVCIIQDGARRHYIVPMALQQGGLLERIFADWYVKDFSPARWIAKLVSRFDPVTGRRMLDRRREGLDDKRVISNLWLALRLARAKKRFPVKEDYFEWAAARQAEWILRKGFGRSNMLYGFIRNVHPQVWRIARLQGLTTVGDQMIAPARIEIEEYQLQQQRWPGWEKPVPTDALQRVDLIEQMSWEHCDHLTCGSDYVKQGLIDCGVAPERISVIPYAPSGSDLPLIERQLHPDPVLVGFVGAVCLRKGAPYFFEVAKRFDPKRVKFVMVGPVQLDPQRVRQECGPVEIVGSVPRSQVKDWLSRFHIFFFPSTCEGCAGAVLEAMDTGLPIVSTPNSGTIVRHGTDGFIHAYDDIDGFVESIDKLVSDRNFRLNMGLNSRQCIERYDLSVVHQPFEGRHDGC
ncbi:MAG: glycosyl transferase [Phycisphaerae bacterium]|nr:MAG: glycosyl transferase [Phycisphaerae bacterium]